MWQTSVSFFKVLDARCFTDGVHKIQKYRAGIRTQSNINGQYGG